MWCAQAATSVFLEKGDQTAAASDPGNSLTNALSMTLLAGVVVQSGGGATCDRCGHLPHQESGIQLLPI